MNGFPLRSEMCRSPLALRTRAAPNAFVVGNKDYTARMEPDAIIAALQAL